MRASESTKLFCLLLLAAGCAGGQKPVAKVTDQVVEVPATASQAEGIKALAANDLSRAKVELEKAVAKDPKLVIAHYNLGYIAQAQGDLDTASKHYEAVLKEEPSNRAAVLNQGKVLRDQQRFDAGVALFERAQADSPYDADYLNNLASFYRLSGKLDKANETLRKLLSRTKDNPQAYKNLALVAYSGEQYRLAEFVGANTKKLLGEDPGVYNNLGLAYVKLGDRRLALANFRKAVELDSSFAPGHANIGAVALSYRDYPSATKAFERVVQLEPTNANAHLSLAWSYEGERKDDGTHRTAEAVAEFERVLVLVKEHPAALYGVARGYAGELRELQKARGYYERYLALPSIPDGEKVKQELAILDVRIKAGADAERMRKEAEEQKRIADEEKRKKAMEAAQKGGSMLDKISEQAEQQGEGDDAAEEQPAPTAEGSGEEQ